MNKESNNLQKKYYLFSPGPVMIKKEVRYKLLKPDICHREKEFSNLLIDVSKKINKILKADENYISLILTGSGTCGMESIISSCINKKVLVISNGAFGERWSEIISTYKINKICLKYKWSEYPDINEIENIIKTEKQIDSILMVHLETSTGMLNPLREVGYLAKKYKKLFLVDAVSSVCVEDINVLKDNIDFCASSSHKGLMSIPGLSIVCGKKTSFELIKKIKPRNFYCDLRRYYDYFINEKQTPTSPGVQALYALNSSLDGILKQGVDKRIQNIRYLSEILKKGLKSLGFKFFLKQNYSNGIINFYLPKGLSFNQIHDYLKNKGFIIYRGKGPLKDKIFQISLMGDIDKNIVELFLKEMKNLKKEYNLFDL